MKIDTQDWTLAKIYQLVANKQINGVMLHFDAMIYFEFLGLCKFAEIQNKRYNEESKSLRSTIQTYSNRHGMLLVPAPSAHASIIPKGADETKSNTISIDFKRHALADFVEKWCGWEKETEEFFNAAASWCVKNQCADAYYFSDLARAVGDERCMLSRIDARMSISNYSLADAERIASETL